VEDPGEVVSIRGESHGLKNPNIEYRNPKQIQNPNVPMFKTAERVQRFRVPVQRSSHGFIFFLLLGENRVLPIPVLVIWILIIDTSKAFYLGR
jgi:hypothetical protein